MDGNPGGPRAQSYSVAQPAPHQIVVSKPCRHTGEACMPGFQVLQKLRAAIALAGLGDRFEVSGTAFLAGCVRDHGEPCAVGWRATEKATWLFGDIDPNQPLDELIAFARADAAPDDGRRSGRDLPTTLGDSTPVRVPAAMIVTREGVIQ